MEELLRDDEGKSALGEVQRIKWLERIHRENNQPGNLKNSEYGHPPIFRLRIDKEE